MLHFIHGLQLKYKCISLTQSTKYTGWFKNFDLRPMTDINVSQKRYWKVIFWHDVSSTKRFQHFICCKHFIYSQTWLNIFTYSTGDSKSIPFEISTICITLKIKWFLFTINLACVQFNYRRLSSVNHSTLIRW